jgi:AraC-like DNA-binding protein
MKHRDLLEAVRYETAIGLMQNPDNTVTDAANLPGYTDPSHFARAFRRLAGVSPREYLQQHPTNRRTGKGTK